MAFAILVAALVGLIAAVVISVRTLAVTRREVIDLEEELAEARGLAIDPETGSGPWSSLDLASLGDDDETFDRDDPYETLKREKEPVSWHPSPRSNGAEPKPTVELEPRAQQRQPEPRTTTELQPREWRMQPDPPVVILVVGAGFLGGGSSAVTAAARLRPESVDPNDFSARAPRSAYDSETQSAPQSPLEARSLRDRIVDVYRDRVNEPTAEPVRNRDLMANGNGSEQEPISWRPPGGAPTRRQ